MGKPAHSSRRGRGAVIAAVLVSGAVALVAGAVAVRSMGPRTKDPPPATRPAEAGSALFDAFSRAVNAGQENGKSTEAMVEAGLALLEQGDDAAAESLLERAVQLDRGRLSESASFRPFFHVVARLRLAELALARGDVGEAVAHAELARPLMTETARVSAQDAALLHAIYRAGERWDRALDWAPLDALDPAGLAPASLRHLSIAAEHHADWELLAVAGEALLGCDSAADRAEGAYGRGRAAMALGDPAAARAHLRNAAATHAGAAFWLGRLLHEEEPQAAAEAYTRVDAGSPYRPFAVAALSTLGALEDAAAYTAWFDEHDPRWTLPVEEAPPTFRDARARPLAVRPREGDEAGRVLALWQANAAALPPAMLAEGDALAGNRLEARLGDRVVALHWAENAALPLRPGPEVFGGGVLPGWTGTVLPWEMSIAPGWARVTSDDGVAVLEVVNHDAEQFPRLYSIPVLIEPGQGYLFIGRFRAPEALGCLGWHFLDDPLVNIEAHHYYVETQPAWTWRACYATPQYQWGAVRLVAGVTTSVGKAQFADLLLCALDPPELAVAGPRSVSR